MPLYDPLVPLCYHFSLRVFPCCSGAATMTFGLVLTKSFCLVTGFSGGLLGFLKGRPLRDVCFRRAACGFGGSKLQAASWLWWSYCFGGGEVACFSIGKCAGCLKVSAALNVEGFGAASFEEFQKIAWAPKNAVL